MTTEVDLPVEERILRLLQHFGIDQSHIANGNLLVSGWTDEGPVTFGERSDLG